MIISGFSDITKNQLSKNLVYNKFKFVIPMANGGGQILGVFGVGILALYTIACLLCAIFHYLFKYSMELFW